MTELHVPPGSINKVANGWSVRWSPSRKTTKVALLIEITDDGVLELDHVRTIRTSCDLSGSNTDSNADLCDVPDAFLAVLRDRGYTTAHVSAGENGGACA